MEYGKGRAKQGEKQAANPKEEKKNGLSSTKKEDPKTPEGIWLWKPGQEISRMETTGHRTTKNKEAPIRWRVAQRATHKRWGEAINRRDDEEQMYICTIYTHPHGKIGQLRPATQWRRTQDVNNQAIRHKEKPLWRPWTTPSPPSEAAQGTTYTTQTSQSEGIEGSSQLMRKVPTQQPEEY